MLQGLMRYVKMKDFYGETTFKSYVQFFSVLRVIFCDLKDSFRRREAICGISN